MKAIAVLGGSRFIGWHLTHALARAGHSVTVFNRGRTVPPTPLPASIGRVDGDRNHASDLSRLLNKPYDVVFDLSAYAPHHVQSLLTEHRRARVAHYIFCSTSSVYSVPPPCPHTEAAPRTLVANTYGGDKARVEDLLLNEWRQHGWAVTIVRPQGVFGPFGATQAQFVFSRLHYNWPIFLGCRRSCRINFLYIDDLIAAFLRLLDSPCSHGETYNVAGDDVTNQLDFVSQCAAAAGIDPNVRLVDEHRPSRFPIGPPWLDHDLVADNSRIKRDLQLGFTPLQEALRRTHAWLLDAPVGLNPSPFRGEHYLRAGCRIPRWAKAWWLVSGAISTSPLGPFVRAYRTRLLHTGEGKPN